MEALKRGHCQQRDFLLIEANLRLLDVFGSDDLIDWLCPRCGVSFKKSESFFLADPCHCPHCNTILNMTRFRQVLEAYEEDIRDKSPAN